MTIANGGFYFPSRDSAAYLTDKFLAQAVHHAAVAKQAGTEKHVAMRLRISQEAASNAIAFASVDPATLYDTGDVDSRRWRRLAWV
jgi:hypothetical protein